MKARPAPDQAASVGRAPAPPRLRWLRVSRFELKIALALVLAATVPVLAALILAGRVAAENLALGLSPRVVDRLEGIPSLYGDLFQARKQLYAEQARQTDRAKREAMLHRIQRLVHERVRIAPIWQYIWPSGIGPRVAEPALMLIDPYPWSAPLEEVRLKK